MATNDSVAMKDETPTRHPPRISSASHNASSVSDAQRTSPPLPNRDLAHRGQEPSASLDYYNSSHAAQPYGKPRGHPNTLNPNPAIDELRSAVTRDALRDEPKKRGPQSSSHPSHSSALRNVSSPVLTASSPLSSPTFPSSSMTSSARGLPLPRAVDANSAMPRTVSIDSTVSSISTNTNASVKPGSNAYRASQETTGPQDAASAIAAAGSAEAAIQKLINEKNSAASHNAQLWRLVEKQRSMILGLNKDLEKSLKEKERYRRKLKDHMVQSASAPALTSSELADDAAATRENSQSPALTTDQKEIASMAAVSASLRKISLDSGKISDRSEGTSFGGGRSDTPQDAATQPSSGLPSTPQSASSAFGSVREQRQVNDAPKSPVTQRAASGTKAADIAQAIMTGTPPSSPKILELSSDFARKGHRSSPSQNSAIGSPGVAQSFSSPKQGTRKAPPAPLQLSPRPIADVSNNAVDVSDSEYEEDPDSARVDQLSRGRRMTREEDDRERETAAQQDIEPRSRSKKDKKSKSKSKHPAEDAALPAAAYGGTTAPPPLVEQFPEPRTRKQAYQGLDDPVAILRQRTLSDTANPFGKSATAPALMSPGLPMSPRPIDRPLGSPMPRPPNKTLNSMPMSPKSGMSGMPLSPRAPKQPIPLPPQMPLGLTSPHLARAEGYHLQAHSQQNSLTSFLKSPDSSPESEYAPNAAGTSSDPRTPGEIYTGFVTEQFPDFLLPPNALPSISVKTSSSRLRPSRLSYMAPKPDDNPVLTLAVHARSDNKQLWRVEKTLGAMSVLDTQIKAVCGFRDRLPDKALFTGHAPAKIDARRVAIDSYLERMLECIMDERSAKVVCTFLSADTIGADGTIDYFPNVTDTRPDTPVIKARPQRAGYLTKRGKNFGGWKARYFVLDGPSLRYFEGQGGAHLGSIKLQNAQIGKQSSNTPQNQQEDEDNQFRHAFLILEPKKKDSSSLVRHVLCAESDDERDAWVDALLQYVDIKDDDEPATKVSTAGIRPDLSGTRSPRLQRSMNNLRASSSRDTFHAKDDPFLAVNYSEVASGDAPVFGTSPAPSKTDTPSPQDSNFNGGHDRSSSSTHPTISGPTNLTVISNAGDWGMKQPTTPSAKEHPKDKKRSMFSAFRGRASSDLATPGDKSVSSPGYPPQDFNYTAGARAVFGVPLGEAVEMSRPADVQTELPAVVYRCIEYLTTKNAISEEGIFRLSGSNTVIKALKDRFNTEGDIDLVTDETYYDIHAVASLLKMYLRELPASILTRELHLEFLQCLELHGDEKITALNVLVNRLPKPNRALLDALSAFLLSIVSNADVNKMNVRNVGIVFAPTLNVPAPLISSFVEDQAVIFGPPIDGSESPISVDEITTSPPQSTDLRSPRKQMFSDLPTPAYHQTSFQSFGNTIHGADTGMIPMQPAYGSYQMAPQGEGGFGSLNDALRSPTRFTSPNGAPTRPRRESDMPSLASVGSPQRRPSTSRRQPDGANF